MTIHQLKLFVEVAAAANLSRGSSLLHISQPAITRQLKILEQEFDTKLYQSTGRGIALTQEGTLFLEYAKRILTDMEELEKAIRGEEGDPAPTSLRVGCCYSAAGLVSSVINDISQTSPELSIAFCVDTSAHMKELARNAEVDVALVHDGDPDPLLGCETLWEDVPVIAIGREHAAAEKQKLTVSDLGTAPHMVLTPGPVSEAVLNILSREGMRPRVRIQCPSPEVVRAAVTLGLGFGVFPHSFISSDLESGSLRALDIPALESLSFKFCGLYKKSPRLLPEAQKLLSELRVDDITAARSRPVRRVRRRKLG